MLRAGARPISYLKWLLYGFPLGAAASYIVCFVVSRVFLDRELRSRVLDIPPRASSPFNRQEKTTLFIAGLLMLLWLTSDWHGLEIATVTALGSLLLTLPRVGVLKWKKAVENVPWNLIIFVGAALILGRALTDSGASTWLIERLLTFADMRSGQPTFLILIVLTILALTSHIYMTSHVARAAAFLPPVLALSRSLGLNQTAAIFIVTVALDYSMTLPVSSKALLMFQELTVETYSPEDLLKLSALLLPLHLILFVLFYYGYWKWIGLAL